MNPQLKMGSSSISLPRSRLARITIGVLLVIGGLFGFLPILGFWMIPVGLLILSIDLPRVRRRRRQIAIWWGRRRQDSAGKAQPGRAAGRE